MRYGMPWQGSKSRIAEWVVGVLPPSHTLVEQPPYDELIESLRRDWDIEASWDGLRRFWYVGLTDEGVRKRDEREATLGRGTCHNAMPLLSSGMPYPDSWMCSECGGRLDGIILETGNFCPNCGRRVE